MSAQPVQAVASFAEIAAELGITTQAAHALYKSGAAQAPEGGASPRRMA